MALTINTNLSSMIVQNNLQKSTNQLNQAIERMTTGYKINHASDNAAGYSIARNWEAQLGSLDVAADNAAMGADMLTTLEDNYALISSHVQRVRDLTEQAANGTFGKDSKAAIHSEITARLAEIDRIAANCEYNGMYMMNDSMSSVKIQVGISGSDGTAAQEAKTRIALDDTLFDGGDSVSLFKLADNTLTTTALIAKACTGITVNQSTGEVTYDSTVNCAAALTKIDTVIEKISGRITKLGAAQNRIESAIESIGVQTENITSSLSTLRDADVAEESSAYIKAQILQQASATLLATANQTPSIALNLL